MKPETVTVQINVPQYRDIDTIESEITGLFTDHPDTAIELRRVDVKVPVEEKIVDMTRFCSAHGFHPYIGETSCANAAEFHYPCRIKQMGTT